MHEATIRIIENSKPANPKAPNVLKVEVAGQSGNLKMKAWPDLNPSTWGLGDTLDVTYNSEDKEYLGKPYKEHTIKTAKTSLTYVGKAALNGGGGAVGAADVGPHIAMWEKLAMEAFHLGKTSPEVILMGIEARRAAREILKTDLDGKLTEPEPQLNDNLDDTF